MDRIQWIKQYEVKGSKYGLERTSWLIRSLGSPDKALKIIHIAGTNGKGSTSEYLTQMLICAGKSVGTFTSPEVYDYAEKFRINGKPLAKDKLNVYLEEVYQKSLGNPDSATAFEIETACALFAFQKEGCEYAVIECGLGGREDSTNAIAQKELALITTLALEHTAILGTTMQSIAYHKTGIVQGKAFASALQTEEGAYWLNFYGVPLTPSPTIVEGGFCLQGQTYKLQMLGRAQAYNATLAITAGKALGLPQEAIRQGVEQTKLLGRVEWIHKKERSYLLDGSHNPDSFSPLIDTVQKITDKQLIFGCLSDKEIQESARLLSTCFSSITLVPSKSYRAMEVQCMEEGCRPYFKEVKTSTLQQALEEATSATVVICGSFTLLKESKEWIEKRQ